MVMKNVTVAVAQINLTSSLKKNVKKIIRYIRLAKSRNAEIVCFPEVSLKGEPIRLKNPLVKEIFTECKRSSIWCIIGDFIRERKYTYNTMLLIDRKGKLVGKYRKVHVCEDKPFLKKGTTFKVFKTELGNLGIAICWDVSYPDVLYSMVKKRADIVFCPMYWCYDIWAHRENSLIMEKNVLQSLILTRAFENLLYVVFCSPFMGKSEKTLVSYSAIANPHEIIKEIFNKEGMIIADLSIPKLHKIRKMYKKDYKKKLF
jgi:predicted amidohydrolase